MVNMALKILVILLIFCGEVFSIFAEMKMAKYYASFPNQALPFLFKVLLVIFVAGGFLVIGYSLGFKVFKNIWVVSVVSITSILIMEPLISWLIFRQLPERGPLIGLIFGVLGFCSALFL